MKTPFIAVLDSSIFSSKEYIIFIDGKASVFTETFISALSVLFSVFYVFNIEYPEGAEVTMEFIQRLYAGINPARGTKAKRKKETRKTGVNRRILKLIEELKSFESMFNLKNNL